MDKEQSIKFAREYLADLLSFFEVNLDISASADDDVIELKVASSAQNSLLIGRNAETLRSMQYLVSTTLRSNGAELQRVNIDIADYKAHHAEKLKEKARDWIEAVRQTGDSHVADLNAADRRVVHQLAMEYEDIRTFSEGEGRERRLIIAQQSS